MTRSLSFATSALLSSLVVGLVVTAASAQQVRPPYVPKDGDVDVPYYGTVTEVTKNSITIQWTATPGEKPKTFAVSETLAAGKIPMEPRPIPGTTHKYSVTPAFMYRLTDVKVEDWGFISYAHIGGVDICDHICIQKRPGGRVPPLPEGVESPDTRIRYHEYWNAYWDLEDKGIPYPEKFGRDRRFPVAPMPRDVSISGPRISP